MSNIGSGSGDAPIDGLKVTYPKRKPESEDKEPIDTLVDDEELFDLYVR